MRTPEADNPRASVRAERFLLELISSPDITPGTRLPTIASLAGQAGVSVVTMWRAVNRLKDLGVVQAVQRNGLHVLTTQIPVQPSPSRATGPLFRRLAQRIEEDCLSGKLPRDGPLPSMKQLQLRYKANARTLRKALEQASADNVLVASGRSYVQTRGSPPRQGGSIAVFVEGSRDDISLQYLDIEHVRTIETACRHAGLSPRFVRCYADGDGVKYVNHSTGKPWRRLGDELGCFWVVLVEHQIVDTTCTRLLDLSCPVAVLDSTEERRFPASFRNNSRVRFFPTMVSGRAGEMLGRHLLDLGHRRVAYLSTHFGGLWSRRNARGLLRVYRAAGQGLEAFTITSAWPGPPGQDIPRPEYSRIPIEYLAGSIRDDPVLTRLLSHQFTHIALPALNDMHGLWSVACGMEPLCTRALADPTITAWVCANDEEALVALDFLRRNNVAVPQRLCLAGINNRLTAVRNNFTSCGDNFEAIFQAMVDYVVRPGVLGGKKVVSIEGFIVERGTTGPARP